jgi:hypothetical protein
MITTYKIVTDLWKSGTSRHLELVCDDHSTRQVQLEILANGEPWLIPENVTVMVSYRKSDGVGGEFNALPSGGSAIKIEENRVFITLVPQMLNVPGLTRMDVRFVLGERVLRTFPLSLMVRQKVDSGISESEFYQKITGFLPIPETAQVGDVVRISQVDAAGIPISVDTVPCPQVTQLLGQDETLIMSQRAVTEALAGIQQNGPDFANGIEECTDTSKFYLLPDGYLYAYMRSRRPLYTNLVDLTDPDWKNDHRINSSGAAVSQEGTITTHFIPVSDGDILRFRGLDVRYNVDGGNSNTARYAANKTLRGTTFQVAVMMENGFATMEGDVITLPGGRSAQNNWQADVVYQRFAGRLMDGYTLQDIVITKNEELLMEDVYTWCSTGLAYQPADYEDRILQLEKDMARANAKTDTLQGTVNALNQGDGTAAIPAYWEEDLKYRIKDVKTLQQVMGDDCISFPVITDIHETANLGKCSGALALRIMDACDIPFALVLGDGVTRESVRSEAAMDASFDRLNEILKPLRGRILQTQGNHDGSWGDNGTEYYRNDLKPEKMHSHIYRKMGRTGQAHFCPGVPAYYVDDYALRVRYILLNCHYAPYEEREDGSAKYSTFHNARFGQQQYDWLLSDALQVDEGWGIVVGTHVPLDDSCADYYGGAQGDSVLMRSLLAAYNGRHGFTGKFAGTMGYDAVFVHADFTNAKGKVLVNVAGHTHRDSFGIYGIPVLTVRCDAAEENQADLKAQRVKGTLTEQSFDIVNISRSNPLIWTVKIGAGQGRYLPFE